jgi:DNA-binding HxlR family transcriptional regulator
MLNRSTKHLKQASGASFFYLNCGPDAPDAAPPLLGRGRHEAAVPPTARPSLPPLVEQAVDVFGNRVRLAVIRSLLRDGRASRSELAQRLSLSRSLLQGHLARLEEWSVITPFPPRTEPGRLIRRYDVDIERVEELRDALVGELTTASADQPG